jgi:hypothetical protein
LLNPAPCRNLLLKGLCWGSSLLELLLLLLLLKLLIELHGPLIVLKDCRIQILL